MRIEVITRNQAETEAVGAKLSAILTPGTTVALFGGLGAGKTAFVGGLARGMGITGPVTSPTYTIVNEYVSPSGLELFHFDMYRLSSSDELFDIGWDDYCARRGVCAIEWSERVRDALPLDVIIVSIEKDDDCPDIRKIIIEGGSLF